MKIVQVMPEFDLAGAETMCENLIYELLKLGHEVIVISMYDYNSAITERLEKAGVDVRYLGKKPGLDISMIYKFFCLFRRLHPDVIHTHRYCAQYAVPAAVIAGVKHRVHTVHNVAQKENSKYARRLNGYFFKHCHVIPVALSELIRKTIVEEYHIENGQIPVIFNGINKSKCKPKEDFSVNGKFKILHIGRFSEQKNHMGLIGAFKVFHNKYPESELWLIGDGEKKREIEQYVKVNNLINDVKFLGLQSNVYEHLREADIFALPSNYEGIPMTLIEAMGTALPIVATAVGGVPDMLDQNSAQLVSVDEKEIAVAFEKYYLSEELRKLHGNSALKLVDCFSSEAMAKKYEKIYLQ